MTTSSSSKTRAVEETAGETGDADAPAGAVAVVIDPLTGLPKKKRTRRGTRGGRNRKRPPVGDGTAALNEAAEDATPVEDELAEVVEERAELQRETAIENAARGV